MKRAALYVRVSTGEQTTANQLPELRRMARTRELKIVRTFTETESATKLRPQFDAMMTAAHAGEFDVLLVWALDRFGRSLVGNLEAVHALDARGVRLISARESWLDTSGPQRSLLVAIFSWVAEQERARLIERTKAGMDRARAEGRPIGRPPVLFHTTHALALLSRPGATYRTVAAELEISESSLRRAVKRGGSPAAAREAEKRLNPFVG